ncbi:MAG: helix-turn-helix transcriptional regulator [Bacilli bacterium]|nr:helix-turn-helix transcriptional regulator [Bacilli bacterium]
MNNELVLKNRLKEIRNKKNMSQSDLAKMIGVSRNTISSIETLQYCPTAKLALVIAVALDLKFEDIFYF